MNRFTRYKALQQLWARAKKLIASIHGPRDRENQLRAQRWQQVQIAERHLLDGQVRSTDDPDTAQRLPGHDRRTAEHRAWQAQQAAQREWQVAQWQREIQQMSHQRGRRR